MKVNNFQESHKCNQGGAFQDQRQKCMDIMIQKYKRIMANQDPFKIIVNFMKQNFITSRMPLEICDQFKYVADKLVFAYPSHICAVFKDHLYFDDYANFICTFYNEEESKRKLIKLAKFYEECCICSPYFPSHEGIRSIMLENLDDKINRDEVEKHESDIENIQKEDNSRIVDQIVTSRVESHKKSPENKELNPEDFIAAIDNMEEFKLDKEFDHIELSCTDDDSWNKEDPNIHNFITSRDESKRNSIKNAIKTLKLITVQK